MSHLHHKVSALIDGELQGAARRRALAHARSCEVCQRELEQTWALKQRLLGLAAAEPPADLFAALGSVHERPVDESPTLSRGKVARRALVGASSMSLAVVSLAYFVGGPETPTAVVKPPVREFSAEFAGSTGLAPFADPAVEALSGDAATADADAASPVSVALAHAAYQPKSPVTSVASVDDPRAVRWLYRASNAPRKVAYTGFRQIAWLGANGESTVTLDVKHAPHQGTSYAITGNTPAPDATFIAASEVDGRGFGPALVNRLVNSYDVSVDGKQNVDGRQSTIITASQDGHVAARFWIDDQTGLLLRRDMFDGGQLIRVSRLTGLRMSGSGFMTHLPPELEAPPATRLSTEYAPALTDKGWACPPKLPSDFSLTLLHRLGGQGDIMHAAYSDGLSTVSVFEERGSLDPSALSGYEQVTTEGSSMWVQEGLPTVAVWQSDDTVYTMVTDAPPSTTAELVAALPHQTAAGTDGSRLGRGFTRIGSYINPVN